MESKTCGHDPFSSHSVASFGQSNTNKHIWSNEMGFLRHSLHLAWLNVLKFNVASQCSQTLSPLADSSVNNVLLQSTPDFNQWLFDFCH